MAFSFFSDCSKETRQTLALALLRVGAGSVFLFSGLIHYQEPAHFVASYPSLVELWAARNPFFFYQDILNNWVLPNASLFAWLTMYLELTLGACLIGGLLTRWMFPAASLYILHCFLATQHLSSAEQTLWLGMGLLMGVLSFTKAGECFGVDVWVNPLLDRYLTRESHNEGYDSPRRSGGFSAGKHKKKSGKHGGKSGSYKGGKNKNEAAIPTFNKKKESGKKLSAGSIQKAFGALQKKKKDPPKIDIYACPD